MALFDAPDTLAFHRSRPLSVCTDISSTPLAVAVKRVKLTRQKTLPGAAVPEIEALHFYYLNHLMALIGQKCGEHEPLGVFHPVVERYYRTQTLAATRMIWYLLYITTREARHWSKKSNSALSLAKVTNPAAVQFLVNGKGDETSFFNALLSHPPKCTLGDFVGALSGCFYQKVWGSNPGFGGPNWGKVADCLLRYVRGEVSAEGTLDTAFTLAHNNGPIFNKGEVYAQYGPSFKKILDVQAQGAIPSFLCSSAGASWVSINPNLAIAVKQGQELLPEAHEKTQAKFSNFTPKKEAKLKQPSVPKLDHYAVDAFKSVKLSTVEELKGTIKGMQVQEAPKPNAKTLTLGEALKKITSDAVMDTDDEPPTPKKILKTKPASFSTKGGESIKINKKIGFKKGKIS